jgi:hypothetical protein
MGRFLHDHLQCLGSHRRCWYHSWLYLVGADYLYDEFTQYIGQATVSFSQSGHSDDAGFGSTGSKIQSTVHLVVVDENGV